MNGWMRFGLGGALAFSLAACGMQGTDTPYEGKSETRTTSTSQTAAPAPRGEAQAEAEIKAIEARVGGRLGVLLTDAAGNVLVAHRAGERFPICSTFKLPLAGMVLAEIDAGRVRPEQEIAYGKDQVVPHSDVLQAGLKGDRGTTTVTHALDAALVNSDNTAANLLLTLVGSYDGYRAKADALGANGQVRVDRSEGVLNENARASNEDSATPVGMLTVLRSLFAGEALSDTARQRLIGWTRDAQTGLNRVRSGLPETVRAGEKTGTCTRSYNDVGWIAANRDGNAPISHLFTVYLDETDASEEAANAALADVGRVFGRVLTSPGSAGAVATQTATTKAAAPRTREAPAAETTAPAK